MTRRRWVSPSGQVVAWILRVGAALCFLGHGAFGLIGKPGWLPYFAVVGISADSGWRLMPLIGALDILLATLLLLGPRPILVAYMAAWALWTALLRPLAHEPVWEMVERAGNYGVPLALLIGLDRAQSLRWWFARAPSSTFGDGSMRRVERILAVTTALLLLGHGALALSLKPELVRHYATLGIADAAWLSRASGIVELGLAALVLTMRTPRIAYAIAAWKLATEFLFITSGAPIWEVVERAGSYAAPLGLATILTIERRRITRRMV